MDQEKHEPRRDRDSLTHLIAVGEDRYNPLEIMLAEDALAYLDRAEAASAALERDHCQSGDIHAACLCNYCDTARKWLTANKEAAREREKSERIAALAKAFHDSDEKHTPWCGDQGMGGAVCELARALDPPTPETPAVPPTDEEE